MTHQILHLCHQQKPWQSWATNETVCMLEITFFFFFLSSAFSSDFVQPHSAFLTVPGKMTLTGYLLANICFQMPKARSKNVSPRTAFASLSACCKAEKPDGLWGVSMDKWPHCLGQKQICSFSYISLQPSVSTGRTEAPDQWSALSTSSEWSFLQMLPLPTALHSIL